jgi:hypothetical protein
LCCLCPNSCKWDIPLKGQTCAWSDSVYNTIKNHFLTLII